MLFSFHDVKGQYFLKYEILRKTTSHDQSIQLDTPTRVQIKNDVSFTRLLDFRKLELTNQQTTLPLKKRKHPALTCPPTYIRTCYNYLLSSKSCCRQTTIKSNCLL